MAPATPSLPRLLLGSSAVDLAVNPVTNKIYVLDGRRQQRYRDRWRHQHRHRDGCVGGLVAVAVNPVTNKIYVSNLGTTHVTVIDGATNTASTIALTNNNHADAIAVNPLTSKVYVSSVDYVTVIDGSTGTIIAEVFLGDGPMHLAADQVASKIYQISAGSSNLAVIDGITNKVVNGYQWASMRGWW